MPSSEYLGWVEYHKRVPFTAERLDALLSGLMAITCNINLAKDAKPIEPQQFTPWIVPGSNLEPAGETPEDRAKALIAVKNAIKAKLPPKKR
jgi:hypothetical protein